MVINTNTTATASASLLAASSSALAKSLQRLSSGTKIITPDDDAAGLGVSMKFDSQSLRISAASANVSNAISFTQTQDGFMQQVSKALNRMSELAVAAQDVTKTDTDRSLYNNEFKTLASYIGNVTTKDFNGVSLFSGADVQVTTDSDSGKFGMTHVDLSSTTAGVYASGAVVGTIASTTGAIAALSAITDAIKALATDRSTIGANLARLNYTHDQLTVQKTNIDAANSQLKDVDVAQESTSYARLNILVQSGTAMLAQANTLPQSVLKLLG